MAVPAPPGMQPWVRDVDAQLRDLKQQIASLQPTKVPQQVTVGNLDLYPVNSGAPVLSAANFSQNISVIPLSTLENYVESTEGLSTQWLRVPDVALPQIIVSVTTGKLRISVSAITEAIVNVGSTASASAIMRHTLAPVAKNTLITAAPPSDALGRGGLIATFNYFPGLSGQTLDCSTYSTVATLPNGRYTISSEYLYYHWTDNIHIRWSQCSITAESV